MKPEELAPIDQAILKYLTKMGLKNAEHFAELRMDGIQWATGYKCNDEFLYERLDHLIQIKRISPATRTVSGKDCVGFICPSDRWWNPKLNLSSEDETFLRALHIEPPPTNGEE